MNRVGLFVVVLSVFQWVEGTAPYFILGCAAFIFIATFAFNTAGGLSRASGAYVFAYSLLVVIVGICYKALLREPGQSNLQSPALDIEVYVGGITVMLAAVIVSRRFSRKTGLLQHMLKESEMYRSSVGCIAFGAAGDFLVALMGNTQLITAFGQLNQLIPLGVILGVMYEIRRSGGTRSVNIPILLGGGYTFLLGMCGFSKQGMLTPLLCWVLPVAALRYRVSVVQILGGMVTLFLIFYYLVPFAQYGRNLVPQEATLSQRIAIAIPLLENANETRQLYLEGIRWQEEEAVWGGYYNKPQGFWDRLQFVSVDDSLIDFTQRADRVVGPGPIIESFVNSVPRFLWPNKPPPKFSGNFYAHEMGQLSADDTTTGISFSPTGEAFHIAKWVGVLVVAPLLWFLLFLVFDSLFGDIRATPWGLLAMVLISHTAPEGGLSGMIHLLTFGAEILTFCAIFATWVAPICAAPILGPGRRNTIPWLSFRNNLATSGVADEHA
ncbi:MAG TPA: hypothetical protein VGN01_13120 [Acidobacteriaceae bacterium]